MEIYEANEKIYFNVAKGDVLFSFSAPKGSSYGQAYDAAFKVLEKILEMSKSAVDAVRPVEVAQGEQTNGTQQS